MATRQYGRIINIGSVTSVAGCAGLGPYGASRGGIKQLTMSLADDWGRYGITVNCLAPGWFKTAQNSVMYEDRDWVEYLCDRIPLKRPGRLADLEGAVVFLASDASAYITGQTLLVDGGISTGATRALPRAK
jgi:gluconate 5-dehydrogenase